MAFTRVRVFASHPIAISEYCRLLCTENGFFVVEGEAQSELGVFDGQLPSLDAVLTLAMLRDPAMRPLIISSYCGDTSCLHWLLRGVWGIVPYDSYKVELCRALQALAGGQLWFPPSVITQHLRLQRLYTPPNTTTSLTEREQEVLGLLLRRLANKEIASILGISPRTVKFHVGNVLHKLKATSRKDLSTYHPATSSQALPVLPVPQPVPRSS